MPMFMNALPDIGSYFKAPFWYRPTLEAYSSGHNTPSSYERNLRNQGLLQAVKYIRAASNSAGSFSGTILVDVIALEYGSKLIGRIEWQFSSFWTWEEFDLIDLPLLINWEIKTPLFFELLKGAPPCSECS